MPWEIKEATAKGALGLVFLAAVEFLFNTPPFLYSAGSLFFILNWMNIVYNYMSNAITGIELHDDGKTVTLTYKGGKQV